MSTWDDVSRVAEALPEVERDDGQTRRWRVRNKPVLWERPLRAADVDALGDAAPDGDILGARVPDEGVKHILIADSPEIYFTTPHFDGYPAVLVRLDAISVDELSELATEAWLVQAPRKLAKEFLADRDST